MVRNYCVVRILVLMVFVFCSTSGYNLSPKPNLSLKEPNLKIFKKKSQSSYFGFTINLRKSSIFIGAPRAQSTYEAQRTNDETGAIYKCTIATSTCEPFVFDNTGNINSENNFVNINSETKDNQWLGASMDGGSDDTDILVACAPRLTADFGMILMHGICYSKPNTKEKFPKTTKITPLRLASKQTTLNKESVYALGEQGLSVHVTTNNEQIIIGAPGVNQWKGSVIRHQTTITQKTVVSDPDLLNQEDISYFGYAVGSGYFNKKYPRKLYYVASAPYVNFGKVYIFDIIDNPSEENYTTIKKYYNFVGTQFGEYFGYSVLAEDLNGDNLTDLIITAPLYSSDEHVELGAIYVFINIGRFVFEGPKIIKSPVEGTGRFGTSISRLGDINLDGFNDIAVGAPFAGNGTVFIYLGSPKGLREVYSQQFSAVSITTSRDQQMFGHGLSKGCDIDNNGFNDFAIGAPNAESVFVYRAYPVVKIHASIESQSREITREQTKFKIKICYSISTKSQKIHSKNITIQVKVDPKRVTLKTNNMTFDREATTETQCDELDANVTLIMAEIYKPIELEIHYSLIDGIPISEKFCEECAAVDPDDPKASFDKIIFTTGCKKDICVADLKVTSFGVGSTYILGTNKTISVTYEVSNSGEAAYLPQIKFKSSNKVSFYKIPATCVQRTDFLWCNLKQGQQMLKNDKENITIMYDVSQIEGLSINLTASVFCTGEEQNKSDNVVSDFIVLQEFTEIEVNGKTNSTNINLEKVFNSTEIINIYELKSRGPSKIRELEITIEIPIAHKFYGSTQIFNVIDVKNIAVKCFYNSQLLFAELQQDKTLFLANSTETGTQTIITQTGNQITDQPPQINSVELGKDSEKLYRAGMAPNYDNIQASQKILQKLKSEGLVRINQTIVFSCLNPRMTACARAVIKVNNFIPDVPVIIELKYHVDLNEVNKILKEPWESFVIIPKLDVVKVGDFDGKTIKITRNMDYMDVKISKLHFIGIRLWLVFFATLGGLLVLTAIGFGMHKAGFFRRKIKEKMERILKKQEEETDWEFKMKKQVEQGQEAEDKDTEDKDTEEKDTEDEY